MQMQNHMGIYTIINVLWKDQNPLLAATLIEVKTANPWMA